MSAPGLVLRFPLDGPCLVQNSPANRVPSHGSDAFGSSHAIDLVPLGAHGRSAPSSWRRWLSSEQPEIFAGFGMPVLAPLAGSVAAVHDGEADHEARRSVLTTIPYLLTQAGRARGGAGALAGNHVVIAAGPTGRYVLLAHLQRESAVVAVGQRVEAGEVIGACGNSGNSTEPHVHLQVSDSLDWASARGVPFAFEGPCGPWLPRNGEIAEPT
ncbi:MAG: M23 family metallopeptidase [Tetrasphaera sp.]